MPLEKETKGDRDNYKLVGASLPPRVHNYLSVYCAAKGKSKSRIIKDLLETWMTKELLQYPPSRLIKEIITKLNADWKWNQVFTKTITFEQFIENTCKELTYKGLQKSEITHIINELKQKHGKD